MPVYQGSAEVKAGFIRKVYGILSIQLLFTVASSALFMFHEPTRMFLQHDQSHAALIVHCAHDADRVCDADREAAKQAEVERVTILVAVEREQETEGRERSAEEHALVVQHKHAGWLVEHEQGR